MSIPSERNIVISGFMGTGKTTVGRILAQRLNRPFVDLDEQIEAHFGKSIPEVFAQEGEVRFRAVESDLCRHYSCQPGIVLSTGGGALVNPVNRNVLAENGVLICLSASVDAILERVELAENRPLLPGDRPERRSRIRRLLNERRAAYATIPHQVDTTGRDPERVADLVMEALTADVEVRNMTRIPVTHPQGSYHLCIGEGLLSQTGRLLRNRRMRNGVVAVVSNEVIASHHAPVLMASLTSAGYEPHLCLLPEGEQFKTLASIASLYEQMLAARLDRGGAVIALGGGVIGDMAGFAAATYLRGVPFIQSPTTLLAMVDASVGGKTGVDLPQGKNLVGAFKQPELVIMDTAVFETLPGAEFRAGLAEVVKHGVIDAPELFEQLEEHGPANLTQLVADAVRVKVRVVEEDPFEQGRRAVLNLGHTFGHAIELVSRFAVRHGEAVALGMVAAARMAVALGRCPVVLADRIEYLLERLNLPTRLTGFEVDAVLAAMGHDKKRAGKTLRFVIPQALGDVVVIDDPGRDIVRAALETVLN
jgi:3-dehydroquinate synthase